MNIMAETHSVTINKEIRRRINFSTSVKGVVTPEITVETINGTREESLKEAEELYKEASSIAKAYSVINKE